MLQYWVDKHTCLVYFVLKDPAGEGGVSDYCGSERVKQHRFPSVNLSMSTSRLDHEEVTVSQLLQSLRDETKRAERLQDELLHSKIKYDTIPPINQTSHFSLMQMKCQKVEVCVFVTVQSLRPVSQ